MSLLPLLAGLSMVAKSVKFPDLNPISLRAELLRPIQEESLADRVESWFGDKALLGANALKINGIDVAWAIKVPDPSTAPVLESESGFPLPKLTRLGNSLIYAAAAELPEGTGLRWHYSVAGKPLGDWHNLEVYLPNPDNQFNPDVKKGILREMPRWTSHIYEGVTRRWWIYTPAEAKPEVPTDVMIFQDGQWAKDYVPTTLDNLIAKKQIPLITAVFLEPGTKPDGNSNRSFEYDTLSDQYAKFLLTEILPEVEKNQALKKDPASRALAGLSSGGICSFTAAWEHPEAFGKVMSWIGSFTDLAHGPDLKAGGHNTPFLVRLSEKKPIRVFLQDGANDLDNQFGNWYLCNLQLERALAYKGYDYKFVAGNGFHSDTHGRNILPETLRWLWRP